MHNNWVYLILFLFNHYYIFDVDFGHNFTIFVLFHTVVKSFDGNNHIIGQFRQIMSLNWLFPSLIAIVANQIIDNFFFETQFQQLLQILLPLLRKYNIIQKYFLSLSNFATSLTLNGCHHLPLKYMRNLIFIKHV